MQTKKFQHLIWDFYKENKRTFPWRDTTNPYHIFVSEVMLQQTQTYRVVPKYETFIRELPTFKALKDAPFSQILQLWSGLGYNRRAMYIKQSAQIIHEEWHDRFPHDPNALEKLPGIGKATARSILVFSYNIPLTFIETNIRRVYIHLYFSDRENVSDKEIQEMGEKTIDIKNPREWYYALMDYGSMLGKLKINPNTKSKHYAKQSRFEGSIRQARGAILKLLLIYPRISEQNLMQQLSEMDLKKIRLALDSLVNDQLIGIKKKNIFLKK